MGMMKELAAINRSIRNLALNSKQVQVAIGPSAQRMLDAIVVQLPMRTGRLADSYGFVKRHYSNGITIGARYHTGGGEGSHAHLIELGFKTRKGTGKKSSKMATKDKVDGRFIEKRVFEQYKNQAADDIMKRLGDEVEKNWNK
jgi:hypothetical protein